MASMAEQIAAAKNIAITDSERDAVLKGSNLAPLLETEGARPVALRHRRPADRGPSSASDVPHRDRQDQTSP